MPNPNPTKQAELTEREEVRKALLESGFLVTDFELPEPPTDWEDVDDLLPIELPPNSLTIAELLDEERGKD